MFSDRIAGVDALFAPTNKGPEGLSDETTQGRISDLLPELELNMTDEELLDSAKSWTAAWEKDRKTLEWKQQMIESYWLGLQGESTEILEFSTRKPHADNLIYESLETFIPKATAKNPDPEVAGDGTKLGDVVAYLSEKMLTHIASLPHVRLKMSLRQASRHNQIYFVGAIKTGWNVTESDISVEVIRPQRLILDPDATVQNARYNGEFLGIYCDSTASDLVLRFPNKKKEITLLVDDKMGTKLRYVEWWSAGENPAVFWTIGNLVLDKMKNPNFNYPEETTQTDEFGNEMPIIEGGRNYFKRPEIPVTLLLTNNLGKKPYDVTNGLFQCISMQDVVSKRWEQIDRNADNTNNGLIASLDYFEEGQAAQAAQALRRGDVMLQPKGQAGEGIIRDTGTALPSFVYENLLDARARILSVYGISGSVPSSLQQDKTVRGKMITRAADDDRIGGGFGEHLELFAARIYEHILQLMYVYYDEHKIATIIGKEKAREFYALSSSELAQVSLTVNVREGSMVPKDSLSKRQEALELWSAGALDPISLYEALDFPSPRESAKSLFLWQSNPASLFPELASSMPMNSGIPTPSGETFGSESAALPLNPVPM